MKAVIVTFAHSHAVELVRMINSCASRRHGVMYHLHLHSQYEQVVDACEHLALRDTVRYFPHGHNRGLAKSMNDSLIEAFDGLDADMVINANDDTLWRDGDLDRLIDTAAANPDAYAVTCRGSHAGTPVQDMAYCAVALNRVAFDALGMFDENFFPAYYEDIDHTRRAHLAGLKHIICEDTFIRHKGSGTIHNNDVLHELHHGHFLLNRAYYVQKWGGDKGNEKYATPFNGDYPLYIAPDQRGQAYPGYDRVDQDRVKL